MNRWMVLLPVLLLGAAPAAAPLRLALPLACHLGQDCAIQSYVDDDPGPGVRDYACHGRTYQAHNGIDFRLQSMSQQRAGVAVVAAASGTVLRVRDGVPDISVRGRPAGAVMGEECGNGVVIDNQGGWETQYCHMARGSLTVRPGEHVAAGTALGRVGLSGDTEFPHVHLTVRKDGQVIDPFAYGATPGQCDGGRSLWITTPPYHAGEVLVAGFTSGAVSMAQVQELGADQPQPARDMPLVAFVQAINLAAGDIQRLTLRGPDGAILADSNSIPLDRDKAQWLTFVGRKSPPGGWRTGSYRAEFNVIRSGKIVLTSSRQIAL